MKRRRATRQSENNERPATDVAGLFVSFMRALCYGYVMDKAVFIRVTVEVVEEARLALLDFLTELSPAGIIEESQWEGARGPACVYLPRDGAQEKIGLLQRYLDSLRELWGDGAVVSLDVAEVTDPGWATEYQRFFTTQWVTSRIVVVPPWEDRPEDGDLIVITILPGPAFGTGTHETTRLCLSAMEEICRREPVRGMLDVGCGSAILSIAGALLGIGRVRGVESDGEAVASARENVARNALGDRVTIVHDTFRRAEGLFDLVVANLTAREIDPVIGPLFESVAPGGCLILSGILDDEEEKMKDIIGRYRGAGCPEPSVTRQGEWLCFVIGGATGCP
jgi:ribosomal protein L11 methyltransferase